MEFYAEKCRGRMDMRCIECCAEMIESKDSIIENYRGEEVTVEGVEHRICPECGEVQFDADALDDWSAKIDAAYRSAKALSFSWN